VYVSLSRAHAISVVYISCVIHDTCVCHHTRNIHTRTETQHVNTQYNTHTRTHTYNRYVLGLCVCECGYVCVLCVYVCKRIHISWALDDCRQENFSFENGKPVKGMPSQLLKEKEEELARLNLVGRVRVCMRVLCVCARVHVCLWGWVCSYVCLPVCLFAYLPACLQAHLPVSPYI